MTVNFSLVQKKLSACLLVFCLALTLLPIPSAWAVDPVTPSFFDWANVQTWPNSVAVKTDAPWSTLQMPERDYDSYSSVGEQPLTQMIDLNGDGMLDFVSIDHTTGVYWPSGSVGTGTPIHYTIIKDVVKLNNGGGWDVVYRCFSTTDHTLQKIKYYGDCADTTSTIEPTINPVLLTMATSGPLLGSVTTLTNNGTPKYDAPWSMLYMPNRHWNSYSRVGDMPFRMFSDLNADGLLDFVYVNHLEDTYQIPVNGVNTTFRYSTNKDVVMLNNGHGWEPAYQCYVTYDYALQSVRYRGDCSQ